jgi:DNA polymerase-3 subunit delta
MKIDSLRVDGFLKDPGTVSLVLIYGPDSGLVSERAAMLARSILGGADDPFRYTEISDPARLLEEATAAALTGGRRVVRLRDTTEAALKPAEALLQNPPDALVILEAGDLPAKSRLRGLFEKSPATATIACYAADSAKLPRIVTERLRGQNVRIEQEAAEWVAANISGDEGVIRQTVELLHLYAGPAGKLSFEDVTTCLTDGGESSIQDAVDGALTGDASGTDRAVSLSFDEGVSPVALIRILLSELLRLRVAAAELAAGKSVQEAVGSLRPPVFFKRVPTVKKALGLWPPSALTEAIRTALAAEAACKSTHTPDQAYCRQTLLGLATRARAAGRR